MSNAPMVPSARCGIAVHESQRPVANGHCRLKALFKQLLDLPLESRRASVRPAALMLAVALVAAIAATWMVRADETTNARSKFQALADKLAVVAGETIKDYEQALRGGVGLYDAFGSVSRASWRTFVDSLRLQKNFPGIQGVGFAAAIEHGAVGDLEAGVRAEGFAEFSVRPSGWRDQMTAIIYLEPLEWRNRRALGFDMYSDPVRREAMQRARDEGVAALSRSVMLAQETGENVQAGVLLYLPVYRHGASHDAIEKRRQGLIGYVFAAIRVKDLLTSINERAARYGSGPVDIALYEDGREVGGVPAFSSRVATAQRPSYKVVLPLTVYGASWSLHVGSTDAFERASMTSRPMLVLVVGSLVGMLIASIVGLFSLGRETARLAARRLGEEATIRRQAEEQAVLATRELAHRVKNSLSIVSAIASQTLRSSNTLGDFDTAFRARLQALSKVHDLLASGRTYAMELSVLAAEVLRPYRGDRKDGLAIGGPPVVVAPNVAVLLSIVLNELETNATKYGAWRSGAGSVDLTWRLAGVGVERLLHLSWNERGGPPADGPRHSGFGSNVIKLTIERCLRGAAKSAFAHDEVVYEMTIPWDSLSGEPGAHEGSTASSGVALA